MLMTVQHIPHNTGVERHAPIWNTHFFYFHFASLIGLVLIYCRYTLPHVMKHN